MKISLSFRLLKINQMVFSLLNLFLEGLLLVFSMESSQIPDKLPVIVLPGLTKAFSKMFSFIGLFYSLAFIF